MHVRGVKITSSSGSSTGRVVHVHVRALIGGKARSHDRQLISAVTDWSRLKQTKLAWLPTALLLLSCFPPPATGRLRHHILI
jgi:hypothetical protein